MRPPKTNARRGVTMAKRFFVLVAMLAVMLAAAIPALAQETTAPQY